MHASFFILFFCLFYSEKKSIFNKVKKKKKKSPAKGKKKISRVCVLKLARFYDCYRSRLLSSLLAALVEFLMHSLKPERPRSRRRQQSPAELGRGRGAG